VGSSWTTKPYETPMVSEIADKNGRLALIVARFELNECWTERWCGRASSRSGGNREDDRSDRLFLRVEGQPRGMEPEANNYEQIRREVADRDVSAAFLYERTFKFGRQAKQIHPEGARRNMESAPGGHAQRASGGGHVRRRSTGKRALREDADTFHDSGCLGDHGGIPESGYRGRNAFGHAPEPALLDELGSPPGNARTLRLQGTPRTPPEPGVRGGGRGAPCEAIYEGKQNRFWLAGKDSDRGLTEWLRLFRDDGSEMKRQDRQIGHKREAYYPGGQSLPRRRCCSC